MKRIMVSLALSLAIPATLIATLLPASAMSVSAIDNTASEIAQKAFKQIGDCLSPQEAQLNVLFVLDASSSLNDDTDTDKVRGDILAQSIAQLVSLTESRPVNIAISSFDLDYKEQVPWEPLDQTSFERIKKDIPSWVAGWWGDGDGTDWEAALSGGAQTMRDSPKTTKACKIMIWLTDGGINVNGVKVDDPRYIGPNTAAMENICGTNPVNGDPVANDGSIDRKSVV